MNLWKYLLLFITAYYDHTMETPTATEYVKVYWGNTEYYKNGVLHRDGDLPAVITVRGDLEYWRNGRRHRDSGPAIIRKDGICSWYKNGVHKGTC